MHTRKRTYIVKENFYSLFQQHRARKTKAENRSVTCRSKNRMASRPGLLTDWPWKSLGNFKVCVYKFCYINLTICSNAVYCLFAQILVNIKNFF